MQEGREYVWIGVPGIVFPGVDFRPPGLRILVVGYGGGQTPQQIICIQGVAIHADCLISSFQGGPQLVAISL